MASAWGLFIRSAAASISSVVVRPLPHSRATRRNGALVMPAMGARRVSARISTGPMFMPDSIINRGRGMAKNIILLSDGTGNSAAKAFKTNVWRLYQAIDIGPPSLNEPTQIVLYDDGVGTET